MTFAYANLLVLAIVVLTGVGDCFLKLTSQQPSPFFNASFLIGFTIYALASLEARSGWEMRCTNLPTGHGSTSMVVC